MSRRIKKGKSSKRSRYLKKVKEIRRRKLESEKKDRRGRASGLKKLPLAVRIATITLMSAILLAVTVFAVTNIVVTVVGGDITEDFEGQEYDCILVLGAGLRSDGSPSDMLADRLDVAIKLYEQGVSKVLLLSGDCDPAEEYDEVTAMENYCLKAGVPKEDIVRDDKGFSTYESVFNLREQGKYKSAVVVTQKYHLYRALYIADKMGLKAVGADAATRSYRGQLYRDLREVAARTKDCFLVAFNK